MNGRTVFAVNRSPVLAWNVEPPQPLPYADMPAAAAAISPVVSPADPYARCWQNQVDAGSGFSYFGALYNNSLPPTAYRLQPGCMANLGQFWPPTPPPDGCGRFDGSNLYLGPHVFRHGENIPANVRNSYQGLGHYSHVVEAPKESSQRTFKRETPVSPNVSSSGISVGSSVSKSENLNSLCVVDSKLKPQSTISSTLPKQEIIPASSASHEPFLCAPDSRGSSSMHPSTDKACFSPPYSLKNSINFHNSSQDSSLHKGKSFSGTQENNCNASPLKNVYFSSIESENVNSLLSKKFKNSDEQYRFEPKSLPLDINKSKNSHQSTNGFSLHNSYSSKKYEPLVSQDFCNINSNCKIRADKQTDCVLVGEQQHKQRNNICRVKPEKSNNSDCKYQKSLKSSSALPMSEYRTSSDVFNIPTSVMPPKLEPNDKYFLSNCSSTVPSCMTNSYANSGPYLLKDFSPSYRNIVYPNSCSLSKPWHLNELPLISPESYFKAPEAAKPPVPGPPYSSSVLHEGLISVAQTAPQDIDVIRMNGKLQQGYHQSKKAFHESSDDDEVQIISVQTKQTSSTKNISRHSTESKTSQSPIVSVVTPLCLKSEKEAEETETASKCSIEENNKEALQWIKKEPLPPVLEKETLDIDIKKNESDSESKVSDQLFTPADLSNEKCDSISIKKEVVHEEDSINNCDTEKTEQKVFKSEDIKANVIVSEQPVLSEAKTDDCSNTSKMPDLVEEGHENVPTADFNDNHNLNLLLNTIEKVTSLEQSNLRDLPKTVKSEPIAEPENSKNPEEIYSDLPKTCGLDLLSVIAGQRLVTEFDSVPEKEDIKSNYPLIKQENKDTSEQIKPLCDTSSSLQKATVFEMQDRLVELQKKYKQKQKELSRLKPKKRFASLYLNGRKKSKDFNDISSSSNMDSSDLNSSVCSASDDVQEHQPKDVASNESPVKIENKTCPQETKGAKRKLPSRKNSSEECASLCSEKRIATRSSSRHSGKQSKGDENTVSSNESSRKITRNFKNKRYQLRKMKESNLNISGDDDIQIISICEESPCKNKETSKKSVPESDKNTKIYSLRHSSQASKKQENANVAISTASSSKTITSKRKSDNPKKYMPSKQGKLSETIIAKHLRSRILFDTSGSMSEDDTKDGGVPEELYDALMKCHLEDQNKKEVASKSLDLSSCPLASPDPSRLKLDNLIVKQRLLALEDGLFYAGYIKEAQASDRYGIALDGQRGNRLHIFTQEELLTQAIVESKPLSSELPEGTRVCAYWSQQYRCLYPGIVGKAPCPSADWSEPRVFVLFDDGDSGQIPTKNIRLIPPDIIPAENDHECDSPAELPQSSSDLNSSAQEHTPRRLRCSTAKSSPVKECDTSNENESKDSSCASINDSSCDDSCFIEYSLSPSQNSENYLRIETSVCSLSNETDTVKLQKRQRKRSKRKTSCRIKFKEHEEIKEKSETKTKRHKKYKEKHRRHHHHHHHRHHHHHHHHHSKKHKHKKKNVKNFTSQDSENGKFIPCNVSHKSFKNFQMDAEACTNHVEHSSTVNLPQNENDRVF